MTLKEVNRQGFNLNLRWKDVVALLVFVAVVAPALFGAGAVVAHQAVLRRDLNLHLVESGHRGVEIRMTTQEAATSEFRRNQERMAGDISDVKKLLNTLVTKSGG